MPHRLLALTVILLAVPTSSALSQQQSQVVPLAAPESVGMNPQRLAIIDDVVAEGLRHKKMPGCVVLIGYQGRTVFHKAYGHRQLVPEEQPMLADTVFDMASLTKPIATATCAMLLVEAKLVDLDAAVAKYIPEFGQNGKQDITVRQLLTHTGGLIPDNSMKDYANGPTQAFEKIHQLSTYAEPGTKFVYSDVGFIVLAELIERVSGQTVHEFSQQKLFKPLGMTETGYLPAEALQVRAAVTQQRDGHWMAGEVHDPRAFALAGVAGHAGLFSTASDLATYCQMLLNSGTMGGTTIMQPATVATMTAAQEVPSGFRTLGWDMRSPYSSNRGDFFSKSAFGHGGFTGTSMWIDPDQQLFVIFLSNRVHPDGNGSVNSIAGRIGTIAAAAIETK
ncbi:MAG: serine hydrolase domain-containing protein [Fuerstiella sp.]